MLLTLEWEKWWSATLPLSTWPIQTGFSTRTMQSNTWKEHLGMTKLLVQHLLHHSKGEMMRWEQSNGHGKGTRAWQLRYKVFSQNPLYQIEEDYWNICLNKYWWMKNSAIFPLKNSEPCQEHKMTRRCLAQTTLPVITFLSNPEEWTNQ